MANPPFRTVIQKHHDEIYRYLWRLARSGWSPEPDSLAADMTQETFVRAYRAYRRLRPDSNVRAWLYKIATNQARSAFREHGRRRELLQRESRDRTGGTSKSLEDRIISREGTERLHNAVGALPAKQQAAVILRHLQDVSYEEIATILQCSQASARANVYQGLQRLRQVLKIEEVAK